jgi:hypothetical protein
MKLESFSLDALGSSWCFMKRSDDPMKYLVGATEYDESTDGQSEIGLLNASAESPFHQARDLSVGWQKDIGKPKFINFAHSKKIIFSLGCEILYQTILYVPLTWLVSWSPMKKSASATW